MDTHLIKQYKAQIKTVLTQKDSVVFAYLFGSAVTGFLTPMSDLDIAVYVSSDYTTERLNLIGSLLTALKTDFIDLVILNIAPLPLRARIIQNKEVVIDKKPFIRYSFESLTLRQYYDFSIKEKHIFERRFHLAR